MSWGAFSSLKFADWPELDQNLVRAARAPANLWDDGGLAAHWRPATMINIEYHYGTFLWWLGALGRLDPSARPIDRATHANIKAFIEAYSCAHALSSVATIVQVIADVVRVTTCACDVDWMYELSRRIKREAEPVKPMSERKCSIIDLLQAGDVLMMRGKTLLADEPELGAVMYRDGLLIASETSLPLRRHNLALLQLGSSLIRQDTQYRIVFLGPQMKNGRAFEGWYPESLTQKLDFYVEHIRPILRRNLLEADAGWFWLGRHGQPMIGASLSARLRELTRKHIGVALSMHAFRHSAATDIARFIPKQVGIIQSVLGHASPLSAAYYNLANGFESTTRYQALVSSLRHPNDKA